MSLDCRVGSESAPDDACTLTLSVSLCTRVTVWKRLEIDFIADLYSTAANAVCQTEELEVSEDSQQSVRRQNVRELLETGSAVRSVVDTDISCGGAQLEGGEWKIPVWARCLYVDEGDQLGSVHREFTAVIPAELEGGGMDCEGEAACRGDVIANITPEGIELRFPVECAVTASRRRRCLCVAGGELEEENQDREPTPSLILRKMGEKERLWDVAKQYRATREGILSVNELADESQITPDRLLLIPRAR